MALSTCALWGWKQKRRPGSGGAGGETITPMLLANRFTLNPVLVIVSLFFWHFIWGIPGAFLAVPLLATA